MGDLAEGDRGLDDDAKEDLRRAEALFQRLMDGDREEETRAAFAAALERCGLTPEQRDVFVKRVLGAAEMRRGEGL